MYGQNTIADTTFKIPSLYNKWGFDEFENTFIYILNNEKNKKNELPSYKNNQKDLFIFITNFENYWFLHNSSKIDMESKIKMVNQLFVFLKPILFAYIRNSTDDNGKISYERELIDLMILSLKFSENILSLAADISLKSENTLTKVQLEGLDKMKNGIKTMIESGLYTLEKEYLYYYSTSICKFALAFKDFYLFSEKFLTDDEKINFQQKIIKMANNHSLNCIKKTFL
ncbi:MAG: hypothetical protein EAZ85_11900 [Bacteroidetes bacterium]|nr:MAG: hypothetical protein EAZ85_11900 [Bacteroidota bacterium]